MSDGGSTANAATKPVAHDTESNAEHDQLLDHEYDGIREYDNPLPLWWKAIFWGSFVFSIGYFFHYHLSGNGQSVAAAYEAEMREAREAEAKANLAQPVSEESLGKLMADASLMSDAKALFGQKCAACHGDKAQGLIGPNLTDNAWIHGAGTLKDIFGVINEGVLAKGMPAWGRQLSPIEVRKLAAFVGTQRGKAVPGKPPEGAVVVP
ncbi:MAG TPA: cbb3-type cytochrome c oxidase N-terminal domain-containing protein [Polyangiaceae bacterium]|nr:cbb3-type cytochrome c oxidase N-terminal domain-containing protein [Polyangiaceae bacterium]